MSANRDIDFFYRGKLTEKHCQQIIDYFEKKGLTVGIPKVEEEWITGQQKRGGEIDTGIWFDIPVKGDIPICFFIGFYQRQNSEIYRIRIGTTSSYVAGTEEGHNIHLNIAEEIYYLTKPLVGTGCVDYNEDEYNAIEKFFKTGELKDILVKKLYTDKELPGTGPNFYSSHVLQELEQLGVETNQDTKKLKDGGLLKYYDF